jgi:hypothetical protein
MALGILGNRGEKGLAGARSSYHTTWRSYSFRAGRQMVEHDAICTDNASRPNNHSFCDDCIRSDIAIVADDRLSNFVGRSSTSHGPSHRIMGVYLYTGGDRAVCANPKASGSVEDDERTNPCVFAYLNVSVDVCGVVYGDSGCEAQRACFCPSIHNIVAEGYRASPLQRHLFLLACPKLSQHLERPPSMWSKEVFQTVFRPAPRRRSGRCDTTIRNSSATRSTDGG